ncbi:MAG: hypothetical protein ABSE06_11840 [Anaerolineaceae bacterium]|jgi:photosystem II stability/assembly factor-like uncharacterized protein
MIRKLSLSIILILAVILLASCQPAAQTAAANGGYSFGGTPGSRGTRTFNGTPNPLRLTQRAEGTTFPGGGQGGFSQGRGTTTITATFPPLPTGTPTLPVTPPRPANLVGLLSPGDQPTLSAIHMFSKNEGWAVGTGVNDKNDHILRTQDGGATWIDTTPSEPFDPSAALPKQATSFFLDAGHAWVTYQYLGGPASATPPLIWFTADGGQNWATSAPLDVGQGGDFYVPGVLQFTDQLHGWLLVHAGNGMNHDYVFIFSTQDGGKTWKRIVDPWMDNLDMSCTKTGLAFADPSNGLVTGDCNGVVPNSIYLYRTVDGGNTWTPVRLPIPAKLPDIYTNEDNVCGSYSPGFSGQSGWLVVKCNGFGPGVAQTFLYTSANAGKTWSSHSLPALIDFVQFLNPGTGWFSGGGRVYQTGDGGQTWQPVSGLGGEGQLDFIDQTAGWMIAKTSDSITLVQTKDGGASWTQLKPVSK